MGKKEPWATQDTGTDALTRRAFSNMADPIADRLVRATDDALFDPQGVRGVWATKGGAARAATVAVLRELVDSDMRPEPMDKPGRRVGHGDWLTRADLERIHDGVEKHAEWNGG